MANISERQLRSWEKQNLVAPHATYGFAQLLALRTLAKLKHNRIPAAQIRRALQAVTQKLRGAHDPLTQFRVYAQGRRIRVEVEGRAMDAESGQLLLNFDPAELKRLEFRTKPDPGAARERLASAEHWFNRGLELEQSGAPVEEIVEAYKKALTFDPKSAGAMVNLGTLFFNAKRWKEAEQYYSAAIQADPGYALAHFDLANLYDERGVRDRALEHYLAALRLAPNYADAHYNVALLYQSSNQRMKAVHHWNAYLKIDPNSQWANIARRELNKLRQAAVIQGRPQSNGA